MERQIPIVVSAEQEPFARGERFGREQSGRVAHSVRAYLAMIRARRGWRRERVLEEALRYAAPIERYAPHLLAEMRGIAEGSGHALAEILTINARTELLYGAAALPECTAVGVIPPASADGHVRLAQNWDWHPSMAGAMVLWAIRRPDGPDLLTLAEAGMVGKIGVNAAGLAMCINLLVSDHDGPEPAVPMHVILRRLLEAAGTVDEAIGLLAATPRASSCNHLLADRRGGLASVEATPMGQAVLRPEGGVLAHANHCAAPGLHAADRYLRENPESGPRGDRARTLATAGPLDEAALRALLADHSTAPSSICLHVREEGPPAERAESVASLIFDLTAGTLDLAEGPPCSYPYRRLQLGELLRVPSPAL